MQPLKDPSLLRTQALLCGEWRDARSGRVIEVRNPAAGDLVATVPEIGADEAREAIAAAAESMRDWQARTAIDRSRILRRWYDLLVEHSDDLALILTSEQGKPLAEAKAEIAYGASYIEWFAEEAKRIYGDLIPPPSGDRRIIVLRQPVGVCAAITPWNFPNAMLARKVAPALAAGCAMVCKPASQTPLSALALAELAIRAGLPPALLSVLPGKASEIGEAFTSSTVVRKLAFTGSTNVGKSLMAACAGTVKKVTMELGGNAPFIVFDDADLDAAVEGVLASKYRNTGQTCVCANRLLVQAGIYDAFSAKLVAAVRKLKVGNGLDDGVQQGPLIDHKALEKVESLVADAVGKGARVLLGGKRHTLGGNFYEPTVLDGATTQMALAQEEIFGPVSPLFRFETEAEAVALANDTSVGLASYFYTRDLGRAWRMAEALEYGMAGVNTGAISNAMAPFGGIKESGLGREGSRYGIEDYLVLKYVCMAGI
ncbi:MAG TPA: NAD-dependent succinate-semialdehyde dehydrogenase [Chthoniobacterales bacterium]